MGESSIASRGDPESGNQAAPAEAPVEPETSGEDSPAANVSEPAEKAATADRQSALNQSANKLKNIALGLHRFVDDNRLRFPAAYTVDEENQPLLSWRVHLLPYIGQEALHAEFHLDEPWDSPHNKPLAEKIPELYRAPGTQAAPGYTNYVSLWVDDGVIIPQPDLPPLQTHGRIGIQHMVDGTVHTIMLVEVADRHAVPWTKPADFVPDASLPAHGIGGLHEGKFMAVFGHALAKPIPTDIDSAELNDLILKNNGRPTP